MVDIYFDFYFAREIMQENLNRMKSISQENKKLQAFKLVKLSKLGSIRKLWKSLISF